MEMGKNCRFRRMGKAFGGESFAVDARSKADKKKKEKDFFFSETFLVLFRKRLF